MSYRLAKGQHSTADYLGSMGVPVIAMPPEEDAERFTPGDWQRYLENPHWLQNRDDIKPGDTVILRTLDGYVKATVHAEEGPETDEPLLFAETERSIFHLKFEEKSRPPKWISLGGLNKATIGLILGCSTTGVTQKGGPR